MDASLEDFAAFRQADVRWHVGLAEATGSRWLVAAVTEAQGLHVRPDRLHRAPAGAAGVEQPPARADAGRACARATATGPCGLMAEHLEGTEHVLAGLLPASPIDDRVA